METWQFSVPNALLAELYKAGRFKIERRRRGKQRYWRLIWPGGTKLSDVLAFYDLEQLRRIQYPNDEEGPRRYRLAS